MRPHLIVLLPPLLNQYLRFSQSIEYLTVEQLVSQLPIERFDVAVLPGTPRLYKQRLYTDAIQPSTYRLGRKLRPIIRSDVFRNVLEDKQLKQVIDNVL